MNWYKDVELLRAYMRAAIVAFFMACLASVLVNHVSTGPLEIASLINGMEHLSAGERDRAFKLIETATANQIPAGNVWSWLTGVVAGTLIIYYFSEKAMADAK
ncbi:MAG: hypothetical protein GY774_16530 [Planctomycetes bacterium]|nr:hypothetical protein [Planctomycetota bacterium]